MDLQSEIKLTKEISEYEKGVLNMVLTYDHVESNLVSILSDYDLTMQQYNILRILRGVNPDSYSNNEIKERMLHKNSDASRFIDRLVEKNLARRNRCKEDRRRVEISISEEGLSLLDKIDKRIGDIENILQNLSEEEVEQLNHLLEKIRE